MKLGIQVDSRKVEPGDIFVALKGVSSDGHDYIEKAIENGASKLIVERGEYSIPFETVKDTREYLSKYLNDHFKTYVDKMKLIGITGTNGKTTSAYLLYDALNKVGYPTSYLGTIGYYVKGKKEESVLNTTPDILELYRLFLDSYERGVKYFVVEVSSQGIAYGRIEGLQFDIVSFTNLTQDHLDYHKTMENYALAKQQLFKQLKKDGIAFVNFDDPYKNYYLLEENRNVTYGFSGGDYQVVDFKMSHVETQFTYKHEKTHEIKTSLSGKYNIYNAMLVIAILSELQLKEDTIKKVFRNIKTPAGRMEKIIYQKNSIIIDYAHTPDAMEKIITTMKEVTPGNIYTVFGCTGDRDRTKRPIMLEIACKYSKHVIITNDDPHDEDPKQIVSDMIKDSKRNNYEICLDRRMAILKGIECLKEKDCLLILGKGHEEVMIIKDKRVPFQDRKVVLELLDKIAKKDYVK